jgi:hypothetical protein
MIGPSRHSDAATVTATPFPLTTVVVVNALWRYRWLVEAALSYMVYFAIHGLLHTARMYLAVAVIVSAGGFVLVRRFF